MNDLAEMWARRRLDILQRRQLSRLAAEVRDRQERLRPMIAAAAARRREAMRQDGPRGFVMVESR